MPKDRSAKQAGQKRAGRKRAGPKPAKQPPGQSVERAVDQSGDQPGDQPGEASGPLRRVVAVLVALEVLAILVGAGFLVVGAITTPNSSALPPTIFLVLVGVTIAVVLGFAALAVLTGERWSRGPIFTWQLLQAGVGMPLTVGGTPWLGLPLLAVAIIVGVLVAGSRVILRRPGD